MTTKLEQAARQALEALESCNVGNWSMAFDEFAVVDAITALREALAEQSEQEPVGEVVMESMGVGDAQIVRFRMNGRIPPVGTKLYAASVRTKDLTDDEIEECVHIADSECTEDACMPWFIEFARAVIAADRSKNGII